MTIRQRLQIVVWSALLCTCHGQVDERSNGMGRGEHDLRDLSVDAALPREDMEVRRIAGSLINAFDWQSTSRDEDPFHALIPQDNMSDLSCESMAHGVEEVSPGVWSYSIETDRCHWLTIKQGSRRSIHAGDRVKLKVWHFELHAPQHAVAHVGLATNKEVLMIAEEVIPQEGRMLKLEAEFTRDLAIGEPIYFHVDNHGANSWHLLDIKLLVSDDIND